MPNQRFSTRPNRAPDSQLSLFSELTEVEPDKFITELIDDGNQHNDATRLPDSGTLDTSPTEDGRGPSGSETIPERDLRSSGVDGGPVVRTISGSETGLSDSLGNRDEGVGVSSGRGRPTGVVFRSSEPEPKSTLARDLRLTAAHSIGSGSLKQKAESNLVAIRTLKILEAEGRLATQEEQGVLAKYSGWGAMPNIFAQYPPNDWRETAKAVREALNPDEYASARASTPNAHYTSPEVIQAVWKAMEQFGLPAGANILEPSLGVGHFFGFMPEYLLEGSRRTGIELDSLTGRIAAKLYPDSTVYQKGFENTALPTNFFDAAVGNIPFGNYPVFDPAYQRRPQLTRAIHDYFLAKTLDVVRPGGLVAIITSRYTMDKQDSTVRDYLGTNGVLLGAIRLPETTFKANAGTEVTTDILFLQKRDRERPEHEQEWKQLQPFLTDHGTVEINEYFVRNPGMMLGQMELKAGQYSAPIPTLIGKLEPGRLDEAISRLPSRVYRNAIELSTTLTLNSNQIPELRCRQRWGVGRPERKHCCTARR